MKKITAIQIENFRAFFGTYEKIDLPNGENLLIYGENGSGKSSLFKGLNDYLTRSRDPATAFVTNRYSNTQQGKVSLEFADFSAVPHLEITGSRQILEFGTNNVTNEVNFIQDAALTKGFLEYRNLLDVYLHKEPRPNLFNLIVLKLLGNHIPISSGGVYRFSQKWNQLYADLIDNSYNRNNRNHRNALVELGSFETHLRTTLNNIFTELNRLLDLYFSELNIRLAYTLQPITFNYGSDKSQWQITADLRLDVEKDGVAIQGDYTDVLNEARLSAFAICLYLSSLKQNPPLDFQILYLDDIFIGLDAGNRLPILNIVQNEFKNYQIFISTYDRHWFELAQKHFTINNNDNWIFMELYVGKQSINLLNFDKPTIVSFKSDFHKGIQYLHHRSHPDYPAAANYFRKYLEYLLRRYIPSYELADLDGVSIPDYKLTQILGRAIKFLKKTGNDLTQINIISSLLHGLIHPLSHYTIHSPIYKNELLHTENAIKKLESELNSIDISNTYKCILEPNKKIQLIFCVDEVSNHYFYYEVILLSSLVVKKLSNGLLELCPSECVVDRWYGNNGPKPYTPGNPGKKKSKFNYNSLEFAYTQIHTFLNSKVAFNMPAAGYLSNCMWYSEKGWDNLSNLIIWP